MNRSTNPLANQRGTSILEVLVALVLTGMVTAAIFQTYITQHRSYVIQDDISEIQQSARATIDQLTRQIRMAGFGLPQGVSPFEPGDGNGTPDTIAVTYRVGTCQAALSVDMASTSSDLETNDDVSCFVDGQWAYIYHPDSGGGEFFQISYVDVGTKRLQHTGSPFSEAYAKDALVIILDRVQFFITADNDSNPQLMVQSLSLSPQVFAENISDIQFRYRITNGTVVDQPILLSDVREILIAVTGRSRHTGVGDVDADDYRYRTYESSVALRNLNQAGS
ncbi:MAG: hypothetical protein AB1644_09535 [Candidatus Zixiibacteriota bacterium]